MRKITFAALVCLSAILAFSRYDTHAKTTDIVVTGAGDNEVWYVSVDGSDSTGDGSFEHPFGTIQRGVDEASDGDTVAVFPGTYTGSGNRDIETGAKGILVKGQCGADSTILDVQDQTASGFRSYYPTGGQHTTIDGFTVINALRGVGLYGCTLILRNSNMSNNVTGVYFIFGSVQVEHCRIAGNDRGVLADNGPYTYGSFEDCALSGNSVAVSTETTALAFLRCRFSDNDTAGTALLEESTYDSCEFVGNGLALYGKVKVTNSVIRDGVSGIAAELLRPCCYSVDSCLFQNLSGTVLGRQGFASVTNSRFAGNSGTLAYFWTTSEEPSRCFLQNCVFDSNSADISVDYWGRISVTDCDFTHNTGTIALNNFSNFGESSTITGCRFADNQSPVISVYGSGIHTLSMCVFDSNTGESTLLLPGGFGPSGAVVSLLSCTFYGSEANAVVLGAGTESVNIDSCIISYSGGAGLLVLPDAEAALALSCSDVFGNAGGDYVGIADHTGLNGNISLAPQFCNPEDGDFRVTGTSPCLPSQNDCAALMGAETIGCEAFCGDVDGSGSINISDAVYLLCYIFGECPPPLDDHSGDASCDGRTNITDCVYLIYYIFGGGQEPCASCPQRWDK